jgi:hypothetical protein
MSVVSWWRQHDGSFVPQRHWYFVSVFYCPLCGRTTEYDERRYGRRPPDEPRSKVIEAWCGCK